MTRVARLLHLDDGEFPELRAAIEAKPLPKASASKPPNWGRDMIAFLRAEDNVPPIPAAFRPLRSRTLIERLAFVSTAMHADYARHLDTLRVIGEIAAVLTEHPEALAPPAHPGIRLTLRRAHAELAALIPLAVAL